MQGKKLGTKIIIKIWVKKVRYKNYNKNLGKKKYYY